jgi:hypothetical protein
MPSKDTTISLNKRAGVSGVSVEIIKYYCCLSPRSYTNTSKLDILSTKLMGITTFICE